MAHVHDHFNAEAEVFDERVVRIVPQYRAMLEALVNALPFAPKQRITVADLGCGTGTVACLVKKRFPRASITCIDLSRNMLEQAAQKLRGASGVTFEAGEIGAYRFTKKYDAVVSSLALHHVQPGRGKAALYKKICGTLKKGGVFVNADIVIAADPAVQKRYLDGWAAFILTSFTKAQVNENYRRYKREDRPAVLADELALLSSAGFMNADVYWKHLNFAVYGARK
jgi:tRNA (cmo5U34)-methyltransferase